MAEVREGVALGTLSAFADQIAAADAVVIALWPLVCAEIARRHGPAPGRGGAVIAMGSLGGGQMTATSDLDLIEANEAFAAQAMSVNQDIGWDTAKVNISGGAISLGHPIGASGARILVTLLHGMQREQAKKGLATLCIGGGQGVAMAVETME